MRRSRIILCLCSKCASSVGPKFITVRRPMAVYEWPLRTSIEHPDSVAQHQITGFSSDCVFFLYHFDSFLISTFSLAWSSTSFWDHALSHQHTHTYMHTNSRSKVKRIRACRFSVDVRSQLNWDLWTCVARIKRNKSFWKLSCIKFEWNCIHWSN